jgi:hypothetical protein
MSLFIFLRADKELSKPRRNFGHDSFFPLYKNIFATNDSSGHQLHPVSRGHRTVDQILSKMGQGQDNLGS